MTHENDYTIPEKIMEQIYSEGSDAPPELIIRIASLLPNIVFGNVRTIV